MTKHPILVFIIVLVASGLISWLTQPLFHENESALNTIVTIISILSGFSLVVISQLGDISLIPKGSTIIAKTTRDKLRGKFSGQKYLYVLYIASLLFAIFTTLTVNAEGNLYHFHIVCEYLFIVVSVFCLLTSFKLPAIIEEINEFKYEVLIEEQKKKEKEKADSIRNSNVQGEK